MAQKKKATHLLWLGAALALVACELNHDAEVRSKTQELVSTVAGPFYLETFPPQRAGRTTSQFGSCGETVCLVGYTNSFEANAFAQACRYSLDGEELDPFRIQLGLGLTVRFVAGRGDHFLVATETPGGEFHYYEIDGTNGEVSEVTFPEVLVGRDIADFATTGDTWAFMYHDSPGNAELYILNADYTVRGGPIELPWGSGGTELIPGPDEYLSIFGFGFSVARIDETTATLVDDPPIQISKWVSDPDPSGVYHDGIYLLAFGGEFDVRTLRVSASDLSVIDADDDFNETSGAQIIYELPGAGTPGTGQTQAAVIGGSPTVVWLRRDGELEGLRIDLETGLKDDPAVVNPPAIVYAASANDAFSMSVTLDGSGAIVFDEDERFQIGPAYPESSTILDTGNWLSAKQVALFRNTASIAGNGSSYMVALEHSLNTNGGPVADRTISTIFVDPDTGEFSDPPLVINNGIGARAVQNGEDFMVVYGSASGICRQMITASGGLGFSQCSSPGTNAVVGAGCNGARCYAAFGSEVQLFNPNGTGIVGGTVDTQFGLDLVLHDWDPEPELRTVVAIFETASNVSARRIRSDTLNLLGTTLLFADHNQPRGASDGTNMLILARSTESPSTWSRILLDPVSGLPIEGTEGTLFDEHTFVEAVAYDGDGFSVVTTDLRTATVGYQYEYRLHRFHRETLERLDGETGGEGVVLNPDSGGDWGVAWGYLGAGTQNLFVSKAIDPERFGSTYHAFFVDATGGDSVPMGTGGAGSGGAPGAGGSPAGGDPSSGGGGTSGDGDGATGDGDGAAGDGDGDSTPGDGDGSAGDGDGDDSAGDGDIAMGDGGGDGDEGTGGSNRDDGASSGRDSSDSGGCSTSRSSPRAPAPAGIALLLGMLALRSARRRSLSA